MAKTATSDDKHTRGQVTPYSLALPPESWETAKSLSAVLGPPNSLVCDLVRSITKAPALSKSNDPESLRSFGAQSASFLVKVSPTLSTALFFAAREYHPVALLANRPLSRNNLLTLYEPEELLSIILTTYFSRIVKKHLSPEVWRCHAMNLHTHTFLAGLIGANVAGVGRGYGILLGSLNYLSLLVQASARPEAFRQLQEHLLRESSLFDPLEELKLFSCCHQQVAHALLTAAGFDHRLRAAFGPDASDAGEETASGGTTPSEANRWEGVLAITTELQQSGRLSSPLASQLLDSSVAETILRTAAIIRTNPDHLSSWFLKSSSELPVNVRQDLGIPGNSIEDDGLHR